MNPDRPHTLIVFPVVQEVLADGSFGNKTRLQPFAIACYAEPMLAWTAFYEYGVQLMNPYRVFCDVLDAAKITPNAECELFGMSLSVQSMPKLYQVGDATDHAEFGIGTVMVTLAR